MKKSTKITNNIFFQILCYYIIFYAILLIGKLFILTNFTPHFTVVKIYLFIFYILVPSFLIYKIISLYKNYSIKNIASIFFAGFLVSLPFFHFYIIGLGLMGGGEITLKAFFLPIPFAAIGGVFAGLIGLLLNSVYILIYRVVKK